MKVLFYCPDWKNRWIPYVCKELERYDLTVTHTKEINELLRLSEKQDVLISGWLDRAVVNWTRFFPNKTIIAWCRRYEIFEPAYLRDLEIEKVGAIIFVSEYWKQAFHTIWYDRMIDSKAFIIPNGINIDNFPLRQKKSGTKKLAMVCQVKDVKNFPLAFQILMKLPTEYQLFQIGLPPTPYIAGQILTYSKGLDIFEKRFFAQGSVSNGYVPKWLEDKDYLLSTSINEGNPNNVIEAMARGIKPIIHDWPGAREQFPEELIFRTVDEAVRLITEDRYEPEKYRKWVEDRYTVSNFSKIHDVIRFAVDGKA